MREIKFRAWNTGRRMKEGMYSWEEMIESLNSELSPTKSLFAPFINTPEFREGQWIKLMQFTDLKDKNGKEIYEGDIVKVKTDYSTYISEVSFSDGGYAVFINDDKTVSGHFFHLPENREVIGNIYENPELLK